MTIPPSPGHFLWTLLAGMFESFNLCNEFFLVDEQSIDFVRQSLPVDASPIQRRVETVRVLVHSQVSRRQSEGMGKIYLNTGKFHDYIKDAQLL